MSKTPKKCYCPHCGCDEFTVAGQMNNAAKTPRYRCKACQRRFNANTSIADPKQARIHHQGQQGQGFKAANTQATLE